jgi:hypothetical protein
LSAVHERVRPAYYLEIGVRNGGSLALSHTNSVAIDPAYSITSELDARVSLFRTSSDAYFARPDPLGPTGGQPFDFAFIDGLHIFEFALRDFIHAERYSSNRGLIIFDDVLPRSVDEAARVRHSMTWTGDVYPILGVFEKYRPDLSVITLGTQPTGMLLITGLDPKNTVLADHYADIMLEFRHSDPQPVPERVLDRLTVANPDKVLDSELLDVIGSFPADIARSEVHGRLADIIRRDLGEAYAPCVGVPDGASGDAVASV